MPNVDLSEFLEPMRCKVGALLLSDEQREKLNTALAYPTSDIPNTKILDVLKNWGFDVKKTTLSEHRRGVCCCD
jgi:hypothetical protein